ELPDAVSQHLRRRRVGAGGQLAAVVRDAVAGGSVLRGRGGGARAAEAQRASRRPLARVTPPRRDPSARSGSPRAWYARAIPPAPGAAWPRPSPARPATPCAAGAVRT